MKRNWKVVPALSLAAAVGCGTATQTVTPTLETPAVVTTPSSDVGEIATLVSLSVPNMH